MYKVKLENFERMTNYHDVEIKIEDRYTLKELASLLSNSEEILKLKPEIKSGYVLDESFEPIVNLYDRNPYDYGCNEDLVLCVSFKIVELDEPFEARKAKYKEWLDEQERKENENL